MVKKIDHKNTAAVVHKNKYDYSLWPQNVKTTDKVKIICPIHGVFTQCLNTHKQGSGCPSCGSLIKKQKLMKGREYFIAAANKMHKNLYDYRLLPSDVKRHDYVILVCPYHGQFNQLLHGHLHGYGCKLCANENNGMLNTTDINVKIKQARKKHGAKYNYSLIEPNTKTADIVTILCPIHGEFHQELNSHLRGRGCKECRQQKLQDTLMERYGVKYPHQIHIQKKSLRLLNNKKWLQTKHHINRLSLATIAAELDISPTTVSRQLKRLGVEVKYFFRSQGEEQICSYLDSINIEYILNERKVIYPHELDIYIPKYNVAIEYNGLYWHSEQLGKHKWYHHNKWKKCKDQNIQLLTIFEDEWEKRNDQIKNKIYHLLKLNKDVVYARKTSIIILDKKEKKAFFEKNHIQGDGPSSINIGLKYSNDIIAAMGMIQCNSVFYLNRYATTCSVPGGFTKLLHFFKNEYDWSQIISFADCRWSDGDLYFKTGWVLDKMASPDYFYSSNKNQRSHKFNYRRKKLPKLLKHFDPSKSEKQNCDDNGILRIWDCGKMRFVLNNNITENNINHV